MIKWRRPQIRAMDPGPEAPSRSEGSSSGRAANQDAGRAPAPSARGIPPAWYYPVVLGCLAALICWILMVWIHPHGVMIVVVILGSTVIAMATGFSERVVPVPREETRDEHPHG